MHCMNISDHCTLSVLDCSMALVRATPAVQSKAIVRQTEEELLLAPAVGRVVVWRLGGATGCRDAMEKRKRQWVVLRWLKHTNHIKGSGMAKQRSS